MRHACYIWGSYSPIHLSDAFTNKKTLCKNQDRCRTMQPHGMGTKNAAETTERGDETEHGVIYCVADLHCWCRQGPTVHHS